MLKVPHHGSRYQNVDLLAPARRPAPLVSVGADNDYGHPAADTLAALAGTEPGCCGPTSTATSSLWNATAGWRRSPAGEGRVLIVPGPGAPARRWAVAGWAHHGGTPTCAQQTSSAGSRW